MNEEMNAASITLCQVIPKCFLLIHPEIPFSRKTETSDLKATGGASFTVANSEVA